MNDYSVLDIFSTSFLGSYFTSITHSIQNRANILRWRPHQLVSFIKLTIEMNSSLWRFTCHNNGFIALCFSFLSLHNFVLLSHLAHFCTGGKHCFLSSFFCCYWGFSISNSTIMGSVDLIGRWVCLTYRFRCIQISAGTEPINRKDAIYRSHSTQIKSTYSIINCFFVSLHGIKFWIAWWKYTSSCVIEILFRRKCFY